MQKIFLTVDSTNLNGAYYINEQILSKVFFRLSNLDEYWDSYLRNVEQYLDQAWGDFLCGMTMHCADSIPFWFQSIELVALVVLFILLYKYKLQNVLVYLLITSLLGEWKPTPDLWFSM